MKKLTKKESQIMGILWNSDQPLTASDFPKYSEELNIYTVQRTLQKLLSMEYIEVSGIAHNKNAIARLYKPCFTEAEYLMSFMNKKTFHDLVTNYIVNSTTKDDLDELEKLITKKRKEVRDQ